MLAPTQYSTAELREIEVSVDRFDHLAEHLPNIRGFVDVEDVVVVPNHVLQ